MEKLYDVVIIGAGPAGLTAAIFAAQRAMKAIIIGGTLGGQAATTSVIENYPGTESADGYKMMKDWERQVKNDGVEIVYEKVEKLEEKNKTFIVRTADKSYNAKSIIIAYGKTPRKLEVPGEEELAGKGVSYCVTCDGPLFRGKTVAVIGGGNSALEAALVMSELGKKVYLVDISEKFSGFENLAKLVEAAGNVEIIHNARTIKFIGDPSSRMLGAVEIEDTKTKKKRKLEVAGAFVEIGHIVDTELIKDFVELDESGHIIITDRCETYWPDTDKKNAGEIRHGVFAAGDITTTPFKQIVVAAGEGAKAALQAYDCIHGIG